MNHRSKNYWKHVVPPEDARINLVEYCVEAFPILGSKNAVKKAIANQRLLVNGKMPKFSDYTLSGDKIELHGELIKKARSVDIDLEIVFEDDHIVVVNKPGGIAVNGDRYKTVENAISAKARRSSQPDAMGRVVAVHRIDVPTTGLVLLAKTKSALIALGKDFETKKVKKEYIAIVHGNPKVKGEVKMPLEGKRAYTKYESIKAVPSRVFGHLALVKLEPVTGRTHQLRIHMARIGHLIVGDKYYAQQKTILGKGLCLCARKLSFNHPVTKERINLEIDYPPKFDKILEREKGRF